MANRNINHRANDLPPSPSSGQGRVRDLSKRFDALAASRNEQHSPQPKPAARTDTDTDTDTDTEATQDARVRFADLVLTGERRIPLRERLRTMRQELADRARLRRETGYLSDTLDSMCSRSCSSLSLDSLPDLPATPRRHRSAFSEREAPAAPRKVRTFYDVRRLASLDGSRSRSGGDGKNGDEDDEEEEDDCLFDRRANSRPDEVVRKKLFLDANNERRQKRISIPDRPSPLRRSYNAEEMAKLGFALDSMM
ncbi:hypothetical protein AAE478_005923 [Parahypoxylon ruwenzoriense]